MINVAIIGLGIVGGGVAEVLTKNAQSIAQKCGEQIAIKYILDIKDLSSHPLAERVITDINIILNDPDVTIVAEMMGGSHPAYEFTKACLKAGKSVVTSNKEVVANFGHEFLELAQENHVRYLFEASVGGGIPVIRPICQCLAANRINEIDGILNGTTNYILSEMFHKHKDFDVALKEAQEKGYAERNPTADVEGIDACRKIAILSALIFGKMIDVDQIYTEGITHISGRDVADAEKYGGTVKLIGSTSMVNGKIAVYVCPSIVPHENPLSGVEDVFNGILVRGDAVGDVMFYGRGAGKLPTASAVVADIIDIASHSDMHVVSWNKINGDETMPYEELEFQYYVRFKNTTAVEILALLQGSHIISDENGEVSAVTAPISAKQLHNVSAGKEIFSMIRILENK